jgi:hypothetical protein
VSTEDTTPTEPDDTTDGSADVEPDEPSELDDLTDEASEGGAGGSAEGVADGQLAYDCAAWAGESRGMLASLLNSAGITHVWQGTTVTVREDDEDAVDRLVDEVLASAGPALEPGTARLVYEVGDWPVSLLTELADALAVADVPYEWDEQGDLVVREDDEDVVAAIFDELPEPDEAGISADDGVAVHGLLDSLFLAAGRLAKHPADPSATVSLVDDAEVISQVAVPFGFDGPQWRRLVDGVEALRAAIMGEVPDRDGSDGDDPDGDHPDGAAPGPDGAVDDAAVAELAASLRDHLRQYV